jgi:hypothetical protein
VWSRYRCGAGAPTSDLGLELALLAPPSSTSRVQRSPVELLPPPPITGQAPPPSPAACESKEPGKRTVVGSKRHVSQRHAHRRNRGGERIWREGGSNPSLFSRRHCGSCWSGYSTAPHPFFRFQTHFWELLEIALPLNSMDSGGNVLSGSSPPLRGISNETPGCSLCYS